MGQYWLGDMALDRAVLKALKRRDGCGIDEILFITREVLREEGLVAVFQILPTDVYVYSSLQRLCAAGKVEKFVPGGPPGPITYRTTPYRRMMR